MELGKNSLNNIKEEKEVSGGLAKFPNGRFVNKNNNKNIKINPDKSDPILKNIVDITKHRQNYISLANEYMDSKTSKILDRDRSIELAIDLSDFQLKQNYNLGNLYRLKTIAENRYNFSFTDEVFEVMKNTPKIIVAYSEDFELDKNNRGGNYLVKLYMIAPFVDEKYSTIPRIYRLDALKSKNDEEFYGFNCCAIVGGAADGECELMAVRSKTKFDDDEHLALYSAKSGKTRNNITRNVPEPMENDYKFEEVGNAIFDLFGIKYVMTPGMSNSSIVNMIQYYKDNPKELIEIKGNDFLKSIFANNIQHNKYLHGNLRKDSSVTLDDFLSNRSNEGIDSNRNNGFGA